MPVTVAASGQALGARPIFRERLRGRPRAPRLPRERELADRSLCLAVVDYHARERVGRGRALSAEQRRAPSPD